MTQFAVLSRPATSKLVVSRFLGCNFTDHPTGVSVNMSPNAPNMVRDVPGKVRKSMGYETIKTYPARINGAHFLDEETPLIHAGTSLYQGDTVMYTAMADAKSRSFALKGKLFVLDGAHYVCYDGAQVVPAQTIATVPTVTIAKAPSGGGESYEDLNLLQPKFCEKFLGTATDKIYQLTFAPLDETAVTVQKRTTNGWVTLTEQTDFSVDRTTGTVTFVSAPGLSPVTGEDNVAITAARTVAGYAERITSCTVGILFGVAGTPERLFLGGGVQGGRDWYSALGDGLYFPDTAYCIPATDHSTVMGYSVVGDRLAVHLANGENERNIVLREGSISDGKTVFRITGSLRGPAASARGSFATLAGEPVFLTAEGIFAVTPDDVTGERYAQNRSYYLNGRLLKEPSLEQAQAVNFNDYYLLAINGVGYLLDGSQPLPAEKNMPYSTRQYVGFYRTNLPARSLWVQNQRLWFGTEDGRLCRFFAQPKQMTSYADDGVAIDAKWELPQFSGTLFYKNKSFRTLMVRLAAAPVTSLCVRTNKRGLWSTAHFDNARARYFDWKNINWGSFSWSTDDGPRLVPVRLRTKKVDKISLSLENSELQEPFGLFDLALEFTEGSNAK